MRVVLEPVSGTAEDNLCSASYCLQNEPFPGGEIAAPKTLGFGILLSYNCTKLQQSDQNPQEHGK